jgi:hypothetical protein
MKHLEALRKWNLKISVSGSMKIFIGEKFCLGYPRSPLKGYGWQSMFPTHMQHSSSAVTGFRIRGTGLLSQNSPMLWRKIRD